MIELNIPGRGEVRIEHLVLDVNGTLTLDGQLIEGAQKRLTYLRSRLQVHLITADSLGRQALLDQQLGLSAVRIAPGNESAQKTDYVNQLGANRVAAIGQGANDAGMLKAAGISVQYQWNGFPLETLLINPIQALQCKLNSKNCSYSTGPAQLKEGEYPTGEDPNNMSISAKGMAQRIEEIQEVCKLEQYKSKCSDVNMLIAAGMAQNGKGFTPDDFKSALNLEPLPDGNADWLAYFDTRRQDNWYTKLLTTVLGHGKDYSTQYILGLYAADIRKLYNSGYPLPTGITECDLTYMEDVSRGKAPTPCK